MKLPVEVIAHNLPVWDRRPSEVQCRHAAELIIRALKDEDYLIINRKELNSYA